MSNFCSVALPSEAVPLGRVGPIGGCAPSNPGILVVSITGIMVSTDLVGCCLPAALINLKLLHLTLLCEQSSKRQSQLYLELLNLHQ